MHSPFCFAFVVLGMASANDSGGPVVSFKYGRLRGKYSRVRGMDHVIHEYLAIPFARPPTGPMRFSPPAPPVPWRGIRDATQQPPMCIQNPDDVTKVMRDLLKQFSMPVISEDCLYLNVYTPVSPTSQAKLPVMVWIHGGSFRLGGAARFDGSALAAYEDVVVVVIQYRLGILGFFSTGDEHARGNWGFLDQVAALHWVQENIQSFGGDTQSVTIFGESAGGISVSALILSPLASGLFHRAISESGVALMPGPFTLNPLPVMQVIANVTGCHSIESGKIVSCLMHKSEEELIMATIEAKTGYVGVYDGVFLSGLVKDILIEKTFHKVPYLLGVNNHEFGWVLPQGMAPPGWEKGMDIEMVDSILQKIFPYKCVGPRMNELLIAEYIGNSSHPEEVRDLSSEMIGDLLLVVPTIEQAKYHRDAGVPVYLYEFNHRPSVYGEKRPSFVNADHVDEVGFVLGACFWSGNVQVDGNLTDEEDQLCRTMMSYWAKFARNGTPNGTGLEQWPQYDQEEKYMTLGLEQQSNWRLKEDRVKFVTQTLLEKLHPVFEQCRGNAGSIQFNLTHLRCAWLIILLLIVFFK